MEILAVVDNELIHLAAPVLDDITIGFTIKRFNGSLFHDNEFRQSAGPEVDAAWASLGVNCK